MYVCLLFYIHTNNVFIVLEKSISYLQHIKIKLYLLNQNSSVKQTTKSQIIKRTGPVADLELTHHPM